ncbi:hypothetical protein [Anoxybacter fermentans]|uniref:hypothetical protein n=1 Tax=Anoxybacter fermentans TaxID=1323375 RepID=UPI00196AD767|nr:hypothetical protein [Anoxybacter fermentans]
MKWTNYYTFFDLKNHYYLLNTLNSALIEIDEEYLSKIKHVISDCNYDVLSKDEIKILTENRFLINDSYDELLAVRNKYLLSKYRLGNKIKIDIAVTNQCNFRCPYCFERFSNNTMHTSIADEIRGNFVKKFKILYNIYVKQL